MCQPTIYAKDNPSVTICAVNCGFTEMYTFNERLKAKLDEIGMRPSELARRAGLTKQNIGRLINNTPHSVTGAPPKAEKDTVIKIARALDWNVDDALEAADFAPIGESRKPRNFAELVEALERLGISIHGFAAKTDFSEYTEDDFEDLKEQIAADVGVKISRRSRK
jgi:hypothetical protein